jgi:hypothetical protein
MLVDLQIEFASKSVRINQIDPFNHFLPLQIIVVDKYHMRDNACTKKENEVSLDSKDY